MKFGGKVMLNCMHDIR